jgi:hypothetical protein
MPMWRSGSDKSGQQKPKLPSSSQQLAHAKAGRAHAMSSSYFRELTNNWKPVVHPRVVVEEQQPEIQTDDPNLPAYLRHRPSSRTQKLFFRTSAGARPGKKK